MLLADRHILQKLRMRELSIEPMPPDHAFQPASVDVHLLNVLQRAARPSEFGVPTVIDPFKPVEMEPKFTFSDEIPFHLYPGDFILGSTMEFITLGPNLAARVEGKSSLGRIGLAIHSTAGFIDPGFEGRVTLEMFVVGRSPILLRPGMAIGQLCLFQTSIRVRRPYGHPELNSKYQGQTYPGGSLYHLNNTQEV